ncbi:uncharacterized protein EHS24_005967 [Apiotrichum porosum]|uniref:Uncharacterized protein n=1 Tax=Apiotrichum porosum TaxID=105984 RepID=A0A427Y000_9TREE|nr:uncharacterized protein EHS24_005967 [Apiotrichum porosum]RSH84446.1 hypothetical protein EHS24_005967 [Apiotrichum porosum]
MACDIGSLVQLILLPDRLKVSLAAIKAREEEQAQKAGKAYGDTITEDERLCRVRHSALPHAPRDEKAEFLFAALERFIDTRDRSLIPDLFASTDAYLDPAFSSPQQRYENISSIEGVLCGFPLHHLHNVEKTTLWRNLGKGGGYGGTFDLVVAAVEVENSTVANKREVVDAIGRMIEVTTKVHTAYQPGNRTSLSAAEQKEVIAEADRLDSALYGTHPVNKATRERWQQVALAPHLPSIDTALASYAPVPDEKDQVDALLPHLPAFMEVMREQAAISETELPVNHKGNFVSLWWSRETNKEDLLTLAIRALRRAEEACDEDEDNNEHNSPLGVVFMCFCTGLSMATAISSPAYASTS